jgi:hypothetical protein
VVCVFQISINGESQSRTSLVSRSQSLSAVSHIESHDPNMIAASFAAVLTTVFIYSAENAELLPSSDGRVASLVDCIMRSMTEKTASMRSGRCSLLWRTGSPTRSPVCFRFLDDFWGIFLSSELRLDTDEDASGSSSLNKFRASANVCRRIEVNCLSTKARAAVGWGRTCKR